MATVAQTSEWNGISRRRVPRFQTQAPVDVTIVREGVPDTVPGRSVNLCERGIAAILAGEIAPGETVTLDVRLTPDSDPLHATATVRYLDKLRCGFEFMAMSAEQKLLIRDWTKEANAEAVLSAAPSSSASASVKPVATVDEKIASRKRRGPGGPTSKLGRTGWLLLLLLLVIAAATFWWQWNRSWDELESGLKSSKTESGTQTPVEVPTEVMQKLLLHKVDPVYPAEARKENVQGIVALDLVVSKDGSVESMRALNGPDVLSRAAMDALRWWKFSPYRVNGEPVTVETTMAVEFKR